MKSVAALVALMCLNSPLLVSAQDAPRAPSAVLAEDESVAEVADRVSKMARMLAGNDDAQYVYFFNVLFQSEMNAADGQVIDAERVAPAVKLDVHRMDQLRKMWQPEDARLAIYKEPVFIQNSIVNIKELREGKAGIMIVGGKRDDERPPMFPDCVVIKRGGQGVGSGVLLSPTAVLTAAHNFDVADGREDVDESLWGVELGPTVTDQQLEVDRIILHSDYVRGRGVADLAIVLLKVPVPSSNFRTFGDKQITDCARAVCVAGYGATLSGGQFDGRRRWAGLIVRASPVTERAPCNPVPLQDPHPRFACRTDEEIAAWGASGEDTCKGDSGGPVYVKLSDGTYVIVGVTRAGSDINGREVECGNGGFYTRTDAFLTWIKSNAKLP